MTNFTTHLQTKEEINQWLESYGIKNYHIKKNEIKSNHKYIYPYIVDVDDNVLISNKEITHIPIQFGVIKGDFDCSFNRLISLKGMPDIVMEGFYCENNNLESLEYAPRIIMTDFNCSKNKGLKNLNKGPSVVGLNYFCKNNSIESLSNFKTLFNGIFYHSIYPKNEQTLIKDFEDFYIQTEKLSEKKLKLKIEAQELKVVLLKTELDKSLKMNKSIGSIVKKSKI